MLPDHQAYFEKVWDLVRQIPSGMVATYGQLGSMLDVPEGVSPDDYQAFSARWVGDAMAASPDDVPWQRVVNAQGTISQRHGADKQKKLLEEEGLVFFHDRLDLRVCQWGALDGTNETSSPKQDSLF